jgi:hypothetical protein
MRANILPLLASDIERYVGEVIAFGARLGAKLTLLLPNGDDANSR